MSSWEEQRRRAEAWFDCQDIDYETAFGSASAKPQRNGPIGLLSDYYEPHEITGEGSAEKIPALIDILEMKIETLDGRVSESHLDDLRRRRSALQDVLDSRATEYDHLGWEDIQEISFGD